MYPIRPVNAKVGARAPVRRAHEQQEMRRLIGALPEGQFPLQFYRIAKPVDGITSVAHQDLWHRLRRLQPAPEQAAAGLKSGYVGPRLAPTRPSRWAELFVVVIHFEVALANGCSIVAVINDSRDLLVAQAQKTKARVRTKPAAHIGVGRANDNRRQVGGPHPGDAVPASVDVPAQPPPARLPVAESLPQQRIHSAIRGVVKKGKMRHHGHRLRRRRRRRLLAQPLLLGVARGAVIAGIQQEELDPGELKGLVGRHVGEDAAKQLRIGFVGRLVMISRHPEDVGLGNVGKSANRLRPPVHFHGGKISVVGINQPARDLTIAGAHVPRHHNLSRRRIHRVDDINQARIEIRGQNGADPAARIAVHVGIAEEDDYRIARG